MAKTTTVFYLLRHANHPKWFRAFIHSLTVHRAGAPYDLFILAKGGQPRSAAQDLDRLYSAPPQGIQSIRCYEISDEGFDIHAYLKGARFADTPQVLFFNSYSKLLGDCWLEIYERGFSNLSQPALVGATGSFEIVGESTSFPNPHVRTNGIMVSREFFISLPSPAMTKAGCQCFEAGPNGLTRMVLKTGGDTGIVTRSGRLVGPSEWPRTPIFRVDQQQELLVGDNRTRDYETASLRKKRKLATKAWGPDSYVPQTGFSDQIRRWLPLHRLG